MKWNPQTLRWEGNDQILHDFDAIVSTSTRPALITHLTGSNMGSPVNSFAGAAPYGARVVGNMLFDPVKMCWVSRLPPEEDEPDVFANMADDEGDEEAWEDKAGTIRARALSDVRPLSASHSGVISPPTKESSLLVVVGGSTHKRSPTRSSNNSKSLSETESGSERGSRKYSSAEQERMAQMGGSDAALGFVSEELRIESESSEQRHQREMIGWLAQPIQSGDQSVSGPLIESASEEKTADTSAVSFEPPSPSFPLFDGEHEMDRRYLEEIRIIATRSY